MNSEKDMVHFVTSHYIKVPCVCDLYKTSITYGANEELAVERAISTFVDLYAYAIKQGEHPCADWLVPNVNY